MKKSLMQLTALICIELIILLPIYTVQALTISNVRVGDITGSSSRVNWTTDQYATGKLSYGKTTNLGSIKSHSNFVFTHSLFLTGLESETEYYFGIESADVNGTVEVDNNSGQFYTFSTLDLNPPEKVTGIRAEEATLDSITIAWDAVSAADFDHYNIYRNNNKVDETSQLTFTDSGLQHSIIYGYKISAVDDSDNGGALSDSIIIQTLIPDTKAPVLFSLKVIEVTENSATVNWFTGENSTSIIYFGLGNFDKIKKDDTLTTNHTIVLQLEPFKDYKFLASSCDEKGNCDNSTEKSVSVGIDNEPPPLELELPRFLNKKSIDIIGTTEPSSKVHLFVNNLNVPIRTAQAENGTYGFFDVLLQKENVIKVAATDKAGNKNEKTFTVTVDTDDPEIILDEIPALTTQKNISIVGTVNEPVLINVFLLKDADLSIPPKVEGLEATIGNNSVELKWNETDIEHFSHYLIYRDDVGPIATTNSPSYNTLTDLLVNSGASYTYQVSVGTTFGKEGEKSDSVKVTIPAGGRKGIAPPVAVDVSQETGKSKLVINTSSSFAETIKLRGDGTYALILEAVDRANNKVTIEYEIILDTKPPSISIISPPRGTSIYESYSNNIDFYGITEPNAEVHLYVQRTPFKFLTERELRTFKIENLALEIQYLDSADLNAECRSLLEGRFCSTGADYSTIADDEGNFFFDDVDLRSRVAGRITIREESLTEFSQRPDLRESKRTTLVFVAEEKSGLRNAIQANYNLITCWSGNQTWDVVPIIESQTPPLLSTERMSDGNENIGFFFKFNYVGRGSEGIIRNVVLSKACDGTEFQESGRLKKTQRFNISCQVLPSGGAGTIVNPDGDVSYTEIRLNRMPQMDRWLENDWNDFFDQLGTEITFPFKIRITYNHIVNGKELRETQTTCQEVSYLVDNSRIDPRDILPDFLLVDFVDFLDDAARTLNLIREQVDRVVQYVAIGCVGSFLMRLSLQVYRRFISFTAEKRFVLENALSSLTFNEEDKKKNEYCKQVADSVVRARNLGDLDKEPKPGDEDERFKIYAGLKLEFFSDKDLEECFPKVYGAWKKEASLYKAYRFTCDRIFGHATPSGWTKNLEDKQITTEFESAKICSVDESVQGQAYRAKECRQFTKYPKAQGFAVGQKCVEVATDRLQSTLFSIGRLVDTGTNLYELAYVDGFKAVQAFAIKVDDDQYLTNHYETCEERCRTSKDDEGKILYEYDIGNLEPGKYKYGCITANSCNALPNDYAPGLNIGVVVDRAETRGFTSDCFYKPAEYPLTGDFRVLDDPSVVSVNPKERYECCCLNVEPEPQTSYYQYDDINLYPNPLSNGQPDFAFQSKENPGSAPKPKNFDDMLWSYRYWKEKYKTKEDPSAANDEEEKRKRPIHNEYNPKRYIEGRDYPACFGQNNWLYERGGVPEGRSGNLLIIDPAKQHTSAFQCLNIAGISNRLTLMSNLMSHLSGCLKEIREDGTADAGVCKELFTRYVCSTIWTAIQYLSNSCTPADSGWDWGRQENSVLSAVSGGASSVWGSISDSQQELREEYGNAELNNLLGVGQEGIARNICLKAFGYDWGISMSSIIDVAYTQPFATFLMAIPRTREFLTIDPQTQQAKYEYRAAWMINPGCDLESYKVELACIGRNQLGNPGVDCTKVNDPNGINCDCKDLDNEKIHPFFVSTGFLPQNVVEDRAWDDIFESPYRYDHFKFTLRPERMIRGDIKDSCFPDGHFENGAGVFYEPIKDKTARSVLNCQVDVASGSFGCQGAQDFWSKGGIAYFLEHKINDLVVGREPIVVTEGDAVILHPTIFKADDDKVQCLVVELDNRREEKTWVERVDMPGPHEYFVELASQARITRGLRIDDDFEGCEFSKKGEEKYGESSQNSKSCDSLYGNKRLSTELISRGDKETEIKLKFVDMDVEDNAGKIELTDDSEDTLSVGDRLPMEIGNEYWHGEQGERGKVIVDLGDEGKFSIKNVGFNKDMKSIEFLLKIPISSENQRDEPWTVKYGLYHLKEDKISCSDYNPAEFILSQGRRQTEDAKIRIVRKGEAVDKPVVRAKVISTGDYVINLDEYDGIKIEAEVEDDDEIKEIRYRLTTAGSAIRDFDVLEKEKCEDKVFENQNGKVCEYTFPKKDLGDSGGTYIAGTYKIEVTAVDSDNNAGEDTDEFEVPCTKKESSEYGRCTSNRENCGSRGEIPEGELEFKCKPGYKCCLIGS